MNRLIKQIKSLKNSQLKNKIDKRLKEFESFKNKKTEEWFSELCFCILTANSKAISALKIQRELKAKGFCSYGINKIRGTIRKNKHRFHNNKARYIVDARCHIDIKEKIKNIVKKHGELKAREWLVKNVRGLGYKEASHFLRNVGYKNLAILDRHIINLMYKSGKIKEKPKTLTKRRYLKIERVFKRIAKSLGISAAELDLYMWYLATGKVLK